MRGQPIGKPMRAETFTIAGELATPAFVPWVERHARRLGVDIDIRSVAPEAVVLVVEGPGALVDAMEMGCLLGPIDAWVASIARTPAPASA